MFSFEEMSKILDKICWHLKKKVNYKYSLVIPIFFLPKRLLFSKHHYEIVTSQSSSIIFPLERMILLKRKKNRNKYEHGGPNP